MPDNTEGAVAPSVDQADTYLGDHASLSCADASPASTQPSTRRVKA